MKSLRLTGLFESRMVFGTCNNFLFIYFAESFNIDDKVVFVDFGFLGKAKLYRLSRVQFFSCRYEIDNKSTLFRLLFNAIGGTQFGVLKL